MEAFLQQLDNEKLKELTRLEHIRFISPDDVTGGQFSQEEYQESYKASSARFGADEVRDIVAIADVGSKHLFVAPAVARYGDKWYIVTLYSMTRRLLGNALQTYYCHAFAYGDDFPISSEP